MSIRLGYACINMSLQADKEGPRLKGLTAKRLEPLGARERRSLLYQVGRNNLKTLEAVLRWNQQHGIYLFRITSDLIPLATHPVAAEWDWESDLSQEFKVCARVAERMGARLTTHPGQYTVLNAREPEIVERAAADLRYHARILELLGADHHPDWGMVLHIGGIYGDRKAASDRFARNFLELPDAVRNRLWLENDDVSWDSEAALEVAQRVGRPLVFDVHHHRILREDDWLPWLQKALKTWGEVRPKLHFSSPKDGLRSRHHADGIDPDDFAHFLERMAGLEFDVMLECKAKDKALIGLRRELARRTPAALIDPVL